MAAIIHNVEELYKFINVDAADPRTKDYFMIGTPWPVLITIAVYLYIVLSIGPAIMKNRQPFKLDRMLQIYDILQIVLCGYVFYKALDLAWLRDYSYICQPVDRSNTPKALQITRLVHVYFVIKLIDLLDTLFFVLRKRQHQVSFLHVYHHGGMVFGTWFAVKYFPGGHPTFLGLLNSFVHVIMYTYYLLSSMKVNTSKWKKYLTQLQLLQFLLIGLHYTQLIWVEDCGFPLWTAGLMVPQNFFMMILFGEFYYNTYVKKKPAPTKTETNNISAVISNEKPKEQ